MFKPIALSILIACALPTQAWAQPQGVSLFPVTLIAPAESRSQAVTLTNHGDQPIRYQVDAYRWTQTGGVDHHEATSDVLATPAIVEVPAHGSRVVRAMRVQGQGSAYYRLMIRELPAPLGEGSGVRMPVNHNLALAFEASSSTSPPLTVRAQAGGYLLTNTGTTAARLTAIGAPGQDPWRQGALGWVLPGSSLLVSIGDHLVATQLSLTVNGKPVTVSIEP